MEADLLLNSNWPDEDLKLKRLIMRFCRVRTFHITRLDWLKLKYFLEETRQFLYFRVCGVIVKTYVRIYRCYFFNNGAKLHLEAFKKEKKKKIIITYITTKLLIIPQHCRH